MNHQLPPEHLLPASDDTSEYIDVIAASGFGEGYAVGNALNSIFKYRQTKNLEELRQARWYLNWWIEFCERSAAVDHYEQMIIEAPKNE